MFDDWDHPLLFGKQDEVAGIRDHSKLGVGDELEALNGVLSPDKIVISDDDEKRRFDRSQLFLRKPFPLNAANLLLNPGPVIRVGRHSPVILSLKLDAPGLGRRQVLRMHRLRV